MAPLTTAIGNRRLGSRSLIALIADLKNRLVIPTNGRDLRLLSIVHGGTRVLARVVFPYRPAPAVLPLRPSTIITAPNTNNAAPHHKFSLIPSARTYIPRSLTNPQPASNTPRIENSPPIGSR